MSHLGRVLLFVLPLVALASRAEAASITLAWDPNTESNLAGYVVSYGVQPGIYTGRLDAGLATSVQVTGLADGVTYYFAVSAYNTSGEFSDLSAEISGFVGSLPAMSVDVPANGATVDGTGFLLAGWAIDLGAMGDGTTGVDALHVWAMPGSGAPPQFVAALPYGSDRSDVGAVFGAQFSPSGFGGRVNTLAPGAYDLLVYAHSRITGTFNNVKTVRVTVAPPVSRAYIAIDTPRPDQIISGPVLLSGWAAELAAPTGSGIDAIHVWASPAAGGAPIFAGAAWLGWTRTDVAGIFGVQFTNTGYGVMLPALPPGAYRLVAYAHSTVTGTFSAAATVDVVVR